MVTVSASQYPNEPTPERSARATVAPARARTNAPTKKGCGPLDLTDVIGLPATVTSHDMREQCETV